MNQAEQKRFLVIDEDKRFFTYLTGHPSLQDLLSGYLTYFIRPSSSSRVQDCDQVKPTVAVLNLSSSDGRAEEILAALNQNPQWTTILACSSRREGLQLLGEGRGWVASGSKEAIVETLRSILEELRLTEQLESEQRKVAQLRRRNRRLRKEIQDLLAIGEITRSISSTLLIEEILKGILKGIREVLSLDQVLLGLVNAETGQEEIKVAVGLTTLNSEDCSWEIAPDDPVWQELKEQCAPIILDSSVHRGLPSFLRKTFKKRFIKAPMIVKGEIIGTIMGERSSGRFTKRELRLLQIFVEYAGIAIENGRLYYEVITSEEELKKTQRQLVGAERLAVIGQLAVSINHEINNPLCNISLITQTLKLKLAQQDPEVVQRLEAIEQNIERIREVTQRVSQIKDADSTEYLPDQLMINLS
jgi:GAF domain-containing protein